MNSKLTALAESKTKAEWQELYDAHTLLEIGYMIGYTSDARIPVKKILKYHGIKLRPCGVGPTGPNREGTGIEIPEEVLRSDRTHDDIAKEYGVSDGPVRKLRRELGVRRKQPYTAEWQTYNSRVRRLTERVYEANKHILNPQGYPRGLMGDDGAYQIDHIRSVRECFDAGVPPEECASIDNLEFVTWQENLNRRKFVTK